MRSFLSAALLVGFPAAASAQDFGQRWMDEATHRLEPDTVPLSARPVELKLFVGEQAYWDSNVYLESEDEHSDTVWVTFGRAKMSYAREKFDVEADLLLNYNRYVEEKDASDLETRFFGRARYQGPVLSMEAAGIIRRESDPFTDPAVADRVERWVADASPRATAQLSRVFSLEADANIQFVRFEERAFRDSDNQSVRTSLSAVSTTASGIDFLAQAGFQQIGYEQPFAPPDCKGWFARLGSRGELLEDLVFDVRAGVGHLESDDFAGTRENEELTTGDLDVHLRYEATATTTLLADFARRFGFSTGSSPFQVTNRAVAIAETDLLEDLKLRVRGQYDRVRGALGEGRDFWTASAGLEWRAHQYMVVNGTLTWRAGEADPKPPVGGDFTDTIASLGVALAF